MKIFAKSAAACALASLSFGLGQTASAFTGAELMEKFSRKERHLYVTGLINMASYQAVLQNDEDRSKCIEDWLYDPDHIGTMTTIEKFFVRYPDKQAEPIVVVLINRACGKPKSEIEEKPAAG